MAHTQSPFTLPADAAARLHMLPQGSQETWAVIVARKPVDAVPAALRRPGGLSALLTHSEGLSWPDARGEALATATLQRGGAVAFAFRTLGDALACKRRLEGGAA